MAEKAKKVSREYVPRLGFAKTTLTISLFLSFIFFVNWLISGSVWHAVFFFGSFVCFIAFLCPVLMRQRVRIEDGKITLTYRIGPTTTVRISDSLYQIVTSGDEIRSFRFKAGRGRAQVSPESYIDGDQLREELKAVIKKEKIVAQIIEK